MYILWSKTYKYFAHTHQQNKFHKIHRMSLTFTKMLISTNFPVADYKHCPKAQAFLLRKCSSKIRLLLRSSLSHVPLQLLGQVAGATECSSNHPNPPLTEFLTPIFTRVQTSCLLNVPKNQTITLPKLPCSPKSDIWIFLTMQLCVHFSHSADHHHSHSSLLKLLAFSPPPFSVRSPPTSSWNLNY